MSGSGTWTIAEDGEFAEAGESPSASPGSAALRHWRLDELLRRHGERLREADDAYVLRVMSVLPERAPRAGGAAWRLLEHACAAAACLALVAWHGADAAAGPWTVAALCCALLALSAIRRGGVAVTAGRLLAGLALQSLACLAVLCAAALGAGGSAGWPMIVLGAGLAALAWRGRATWAAGVAGILLCGGACGVGNV